MELGNFGGEVLKVLEVHSERTSLTFLDQELGDGVMIKVLKVLEVKDDRPSFTPLDELLDLR